MLIYHPAFDINHARLRLIQLLEGLRGCEVPFDLLRILDFYFLFPHLLADVQLRQGTARIKRELGRRKNKYNRVPAPKILIRQMEGIHETAVRALQASSLVDVPAQDMAFVKRSDTPLPEELKGVIAGQPEQEQALVKVLTGEVATIPLNGPNGLKARSGLLEYRYDPA
jgi:hypothetical protein